MPHPERATSELLGNTDGRLLFRQLMTVRKIQSANPQPELVNT
jgi:hypothetical protein